MWETVRAITARRQAEKLPAQEPDPATSDILCPVGGGTAEQPTAGPRFRRVKQKEIQMSLIVGAYPAQGPGTLQQQFFEELAGISSIRGLELPYRASGGDPAGRPVSPPCSAVVTAIPGTMQRLGLDGHFGLASTDSNGRRSAVDFVAGIKDYVTALVAAGHPVEAVELHSAPPQHASAAAFAESLEDILGWDWRGTKRDRTLRCTPQREDPGKGLPAVRGGGPGRGAPSGNRDGTTSGSS